MTLLDTFKKIIFPLSTFTYIPQIKKLGESNLTSTLPSTTTDTTHAAPTKSAFTPLIPTVLIIAHTLRLLGYILGGNVKPEIALQSVCMIFLMLAMLKAYYKSSPPPTSSHPLSSTSKSNPLNPTVLTNRVLNTLTSTSTILLRTLLTLILLTLFLDILLIHPPQHLNLPNIPVILSLALETFPPLIQLQKIQSNGGSTTGISPIVPLSWLLGDLSRVAIFTQGGDGMFSVGAGICVIIDVAVVGYVGIPGFGADGGEEEGRVKYT